MTNNLKEVVTEFLNGNWSAANNLMHANYDFEWTSNSEYCSDDLPFEFMSVDSHGGEGEGDDFWNVIEVRLPDDPDNTLLVKLQGWYTSYNGADYSSWSFVKPVQKTVTVYQ